VTELLAPPIRVLIIDDHSMFADSLARLLSDDDDITIVGIARDGTEGVHFAVELEPDVALIDYRLPDRDGVAVAGEIRRLAPGVRLVMLTGATNDRVLLAAVEAGCSGLLTKDRAAAEVTEAVRRAASGASLIAPGDLARLFATVGGAWHSIGSDLTDREREIFSLLARGRTNPAIAIELHLSIHTIRNYVQTILTKLGAHTKLEAVATGIREGVIEYPANR
jgi:two-component system response regulator DevR